MAQRQAGLAAKHTVVLDWDGTLVPSMWPEQPTEFMPGGTDAVFRLHQAGIKLMVASARMNPYDPFTSVRLDPAKVAREKQYIRHTLDRQGMTFVDIWDRHGKPSASRYVDDKAVKYTGRPGSWHAITNTLLLDLGVEAPLFPAFDMEADT